jgi:hypothetical protein
LCTVNIADKKGSWGDAASIPIVLKPKPISSVLKAVYYQLEAEPRPGQPKGAQSWKEVFQLHVHMAIFCPRDLGHVTFPSSLILCFYLVKISHYTFPVLL